MMINMHFWPSISGLAKKVANVVYKAPTNEEEKEEEDFDTHFKRERKASSSRGPQ